MVFCGIQFFQVGLCMRTLQLQKKSTLTPRYFYGRTAQPKTSSLHQFKGRPYTQSGEGFYTLMEQDRIILDLNLFISHIVRSDRSREIGLRRKKGFPSAFSQSNTSAMRTI